MTACGSGDTAALAELFQRHRQAVWGFFRRRVSDRSRAEELSQDVFVALLKNAGRYRPESSFRSYLFGIAFRALLAERRRVRTVEARTNSDVRHDEIPALAVDPDASLEIRRALAKLDDADREIVMLR